MYTAWVIITLMIIGFVPLQIQPKTAPKDETTIHSLELSRGSTLSKEAFTAQTLDD